ncbi:MAG TPA: adenylate/guanylate cyclase domain-containing protein [Gaiellaceae bacterium]|nr:adenylate/guanylate cyclase domain-containing protein [Gaiellaceae bacterium]
MVETRKTVTIVFADVTGSTALGEQTDPEAMRRIMERYFEEMRAVLEKHGGTVEKFIGDAVMAVFGIPVVHEDDALRAVRAAAEMRERLAALNEDFERQRGLTIAVRTGVNTGEVVAGNPAQGQAFATGDAVNVAARLEQTAEPGEILLGPLTHRLVREAVRADAVEPLELKGKADPLEAWRLVEVLPGVPAFTRRIDAPFVGRKEELARLLAAFDEARATATAQLVTVVGAPGIGKSRLLRELITSIGDGARVVVGRCLSYGRASRTGRSPRSCVRSRDPTPVPVSASCSAPNPTGASPSSACSGPLEQLMPRPARRRSSGRRACSSSASRATAR